MLYIDHTSDRLFKLDSSIIFELSVNTIYVASVGIKKMYIEILSMKIDEGLDGV